MDFSLNGNNYRVEKLNGKAQFHLMRRIAPLIPGLAGLVQSAAARQDTGGLLADENLGTLLEPFAKALEAMTDEGSWKIITTCLSVVKREKAGSFTPIFIEAADRFMFSDLEEVAAYLPIVTRVIQFSLGPSIAALLTGQLGGAVDKTP